MKVGNYCKREKLFDNDLIVFPLNVTNEHWLLLIVCYPGLINICIIRLIFSSTSCHFRFQTLTDLMISTLVNHAMPWHQQKKVGILLATTRRALLLDINQQLNFLKKFQSAVNIWMDWPQSSIWNCKGLPAMINYKCKVWNQRCQIQ